MGAENNLTKTKKVKDKTEINKERKEKANNETDGKIVGKKYEEEKQRRK